MKIGGLDIGTTGCKLTIFDAKGKQIDAAYQSYTIMRTGDKHEIDASALMNAVYKVIRELALKYNDIAGIGVTSFGESFVLTDEKGIPLSLSMLYTDPRGKEECQKLCSQLTIDKITSITGLYPHEMYSISKIMWIKKHQPDIYAHTKHIFLIEDFVVFNLTGNAQIDYSLAARTMAFDINLLAWSEKIFSTADIDVSLMSKSVASGTSAGKITPEIVEMTGLNRLCEIITVSHDQVAAVVGTGAFTGGIAIDGAGTVECLTPIFDSLPNIQALSKGSFAVVPYVMKGKYVAYAFSYTGGALLQWCIDTLAKDEKRIAEIKKTSVNELLESQLLTNEPTGILVLPHFAGAATPYMDTGSKGAIIGLTTAHTLADIYRACMEGVGYEMYLNYELMASAGIKFRSLNATGGGAHSKLWMQMKADILNLPITTQENVNAGTIGSAMLTGVAIGIYKDLSEAANLLVKKGETYYPCEEMHKKYMKIYQRYKGVYNAIRPLV